MKNIENISHLFVSGFHTKASLSTPANTCSFQGGYCRWFYNVSISHFCLGNIFWDKEEPIDMIESSGKVATLLKGVRGVFKFIFPKSVLLPF